MEWVLHQYSQVGMGWESHQCTMAGKQWVCYQTRQVDVQWVSHQCTMEGRQLAPLHICTYT